MVSDFSAPLEETSVEGVPEEKQEEKSINTCYLTGFTGFTIPYQGTQEPFSIDPLFNLNPKFTSTAAKRPRHKKVGPHFS
jgi:hypothetical protein